MKPYKIIKSGRVSYVIADEHKGYLTWPKTRIPFLDQDKLNACPDKADIQTAITNAEGDETLTTALWQSARILQLTYRSGE